MTSCVLHALSLSFVLYYHRGYERGRSSEIAILGLDFSHKKSSSYFYVEYLDLKITKTLVTYFVLVF
jgi:hypothetical protein